VCWVYEREELHLDRQNISNKAKNFVGHKFWARGYYVSTVGSDEKTIRTYIQNQETDDRRLDLLNLFDK